jgi:hypothetical protein
MTPPALVPLEMEVEIETKNVGQLLRGTGKGALQSTLCVPSDSELQKLNEEELKAAIKSAWKKYERLAKKEMGQLLYWLREKLKAQGIRNDLRQEDKGFGAWVEQTIEISRRTADRWADEYGIANGLMKRKSTSRQDDQKLFAHEYDDFLEAERHKHKRQIQMNYWVSSGEYQRHEQAIKVLKKHFKTSSIQDAIVKGVQYAAQAIDRGENQKRTIATGRGSQQRISTNRRGN